MKTKCIIQIGILFLCALNIQAQDIERTGFIFGGAVGGGTLIQKNENQDSESFGKFSILNMKIGYMINPETAICLHVPSGGHRENGETRAFEASLITAQHWFADRFWASAGVGLAMDMPPFYDTKIEEPDFYFGPAASVSAGYEIWRKGKFALDIQGRVLYGNYDVEGVRRQSTAFDLMIGFNWY